MWNILTPEELKALDDKLARAQKIWSLAHVYTPLDSTDKRTIEVDAMRREMYDAAEYVWADKL